MLRLLDTSEQKTLKKLDREFGKLPLSVLKKCSNNLCFKVSAAFKKKNSIALRF